MVRVRIIKKYLDSLKIIITNLETYKLWLLKQYIRIKEFKTKTFS